MFPEAKIIGIDMDVERLIQAEELSKGIDNIKFFDMEASNLLFEDNSFDLVISRFLLEYIKEPSLIIKEFARVCKSGGKVFLQNLDSQYSINYPADGWPTEIVDKVLSGLQQTGFDPFVGRKLHNLLCQAEIKNIDVKIEGYNVFAGEISENDLNIMGMELDGLLPAVNQILGGEKEANALKKQIVDYFLREDTISLSLVFSVSGTKP